MKVKYKHTNIIANDWELLAQFYEEVFGCIRVPPIRDLSGDWLEKGTGVKDARVRGIHVLLPGYGDDGPTLEIFQYEENLEKPTAAANREGFGHLAFEVENVEEATRAVIQHGGSKAGGMVSADVNGKRITFIYLKDPEGNIIELQAWK